MRKRKKAKRSKKTKKNKATKKRLKSVFDPDPKRVKKILSRFQKNYPNAHCALTYSNPLQLLISTILSAQCTDKRVNLVTPALFDRYPTAKDFAESNLDELQVLIRSTGFYQNKARNIQKCCKVIVEHHKGQVPQTMEELTKLGGVGRKTANVVLGNAFGIPGLVVDTHVTRISNLLGLTNNKDAVKIEKDLMKIVPKKEWTNWAHYLITHGREVCKARRPACDRCFLNDLCPSSLV